MRRFLTNDLLTNDLLTNGLPTRLISALITSTVGASVVIAAQLLMSSPANAQVSLSPLVIESQTERGQARNVITVTNSSNQPFRARITAEAFTYDPETGFTTLAPGAPHDLTPYLLFSPTELVVPPNSSRRIRLMAQFPPDAEQQEYRAVIFTEPLQARSTESGAVRVNTVTRVAATLYVRNGELLPPALAGESVTWDSAAQSLQMKVSNSGDASVRPIANWTLSQGEQVIATGRSRSTAVMAESSRNFVLEPTAEPLDRLSPGIYQLRGEFVWGRNTAPQVHPFELDLQVFDDN